MGNYGRELRNKGTRSVWALRVLLLLAPGFLFLTPLALAQWGEPANDPTIKDLFYQLLRSPFGTLLMVFCGLGGFAMLYMQREGKAGDKIPVAAVALLLTAIGLFILRVMVTSGVLGARYLEWN